MDKYKNKGMRLTPQRLAILEFLDGNTDHPSAESIYEEIKKKHPTTSFATVYKTLETLKTKGGITELTIDPERRRYDPNTQSHHHLICLGCKKIVDIEANFSLNVPEAEAQSFEVIGNHIEFYGYCPNCKKTEGRL